MWFLFVVYIYNLSISKLYIVKIAGIMGLFGQSKKDPKELVCVW